jgi:hypothetical protein
MNSSVYHRRITRSGQPTNMCPEWGLGVGLPTLHRKIFCIMKQREMVGDIA